MRDTAQSKSSKRSEQEEIFLIRGSNVNVQRAELEIKRMIVDIGTFLTEVLRIF